jgi:putative transposase
MWTDSARAQYRRLAERYATDLTDSEFALIEPRLPGRNRIGRPRRVDLRAVLDAIFYLLRSGCQWALLPKEFPPRSTVYDYFRRWWDDGTLLAVHHALHARARAAAGREPQPTAGIVDSQSAKTAEAGGPRGFDAGKKVNGRKRHLLVDTLALRAIPRRDVSKADRGLPLRAIVHPASVQDRDGLAPLLARIRRRFPWLRLLYADGGYQGEVAARTARAERLELAIVKRCDRAQGLVVLPRRWAVERTFAWLGRNRRLSKDVEALVETSTAHLYLAAISLLLRRLARQ